MSDSPLSGCLQGSDVGKSVDPAQAYLLVETFEDLNIGDDLPIWQYGVDVPHCLQTGAVTVPDKSLRRMPQHVKSHAFLSAEADASVLLGYLLI